YPAKPVRILVPNAPGGGIDILARLLAQKITGSWSHSVVVDNRSGASGAIAMEIVAHSVADGYTLLIGGNQVVVASPLKMVSFDTRKAYAPIVQMSSSPYV